MAVQPSLPQLSSGSSLYLVEGPMLSPELHDLIIDQVTDGSTLHSCALVCRNWLPRSRYHLFRNISVTTLGQHLAFRTFLNHGNPCVFDYTTHLSICQYEHGNYDTMPWFDPQFLNLDVSKLTELTSMHVCNWQTQFEDMEVGWYLLGHFSGIKKLELESWILVGMADLRTILCAFPNLCELALNDMAPWDDDWGGGWPEPAIAPPTRPLSYLKLVDCPKEMIQWVALEYVDPRALVTVHVGLDQDLEPIGFMLQKAGSSIKNLTLECGCGRPTVEGKVDLAYNKSLRSLTFIAPIYPRDPAITALLSQVASDELELVEFEFSDKKYVLMEGRVDWQMIDNILSGPRFPALKEVSIVLSYASQISGPEPHWEIKMPQLTRKGILRAKQSVG
ncbi:hypothetical protein JAAARDRAFT_63404 [Jaapia argillacea MUCL 33604]|uniref:F-box domain-containing protein n=1 Tax=Jaapia argillacea MUCL 33604 TaxID=933084 RepID=A0A067P526_9AGAM|nr:hypothetical protein JAAARDRAFT_63404 [Jaapia argillacea MUCL 33604]